MIRFSTVYFFWICNKSGGLLSPCFPLNLFYCYRNFVSPNWPRKFVNHWRLITRQHIKRTWKKWRLDFSAAVTNQQRKHARSSSVRGQRGQHHTLHEQQVVRASLVHFQRRSGGMLSIGDASETGGKSEQRLGFCWDGSWGRRKRKIWILGFHCFYHEGPYSSVIFLLGINF